MAIVAKTVAGIVLMDSKKKVTISWSGGKDSAFALYKVLQAREFEVVSLHTVINEETKRVGMHGVRETLIERQAEALGLPLQKLYLEGSEDHDAYTRLMSDFYTQCIREHIHAVVFGDIFLEDLKIFREQLLKSSGLQGIFPLWKQDTRQLITDFIHADFKTLICAANAKYFSAAQMGKTIDDAFVRQLPEEVDPCGENGEFHTFVYQGPIFKTPASYVAGEVVKKTYTYHKADASGAPVKIETTFLFQDLLP
ncbi:diphthine--ammonia ligase [Chryseosolibacter histidini]|nr:diphthine--ammonia ligase [Chryseosolibacter histidini]